MLITIDLDSQHFEDLRATLIAILDLKMKLLRISKTRKGYHIVAWCDLAIAKDFSIYDIDDKDVRELIRQRMNHKFYDSIKEKGERSHLIRYLLGDDPYRIIYDIIRKDVMPEQVLFNKHFKYYKYRR